MAARLAAPVSSLATVARIGGHAALTRPPMAVRTVSRVDMTGRTILVMTLQAVAKILMVVEDTARATRRDEVSRDGEDRTGDGGRPHARPRQGGVRGTPRTARMAAATAHQAAAMRCPAEVRTKPTTFATGRAMAAMRLPAVANALTHAAISGVHTAVMRCLVAMRTAATAEESATPHRGRPAWRLRSGTARGRRRRAATSRPRGAPRGRWPCRGGPKSDATRRPRSGVPAGAPWPRMATPGPARPRPSRPPRAAGAASRWCDRERLRGWWPTSCRPNRSPG